MSDLQIVLFERYDGVRFVLTKALDKFQNDFSIQAFRHKRLIKKFIDQNKVDILITELSKVDPVGVEISRYVHEQEPDIKIVWITVVGCHEYRQEMKDLEIALCFEKPLDLSSFRKGIMTLIP
jgi:DNA-binding NarL/FixJ family response regulator